MSVLYRPLFLSVLRAFTGILVICVYGASHAQSDTLMPSWDPYYSIVQKSMREDIPLAFRPADHPVMAITLTDRECRKKQRYVYPTLDEKALWGWYLPRPELQSAMCQRLPAQGSVIVLVKEQPQDQVRQTFIHEYGHHVYFEILTHDERQAWITIWMLDEAEDCINAYASLSPWEGFAETFRWWVQGHPRTTKIHKDFLEKITSRLWREYHLVRPTTEVKK